MNPACNAARMIGARVLIIGDIMLDHYQLGVVERISPEAPVPVVRVVEDKFRVGGAGNVAQNIALLGGLPTLISVCGTDEYGDELERICRSLHIDAHLVRSKTRKTTLKTRIMAAHQQILRVDQEISDALDREESERLHEIIDKFVDQFHVIILSDYGKGVISGEFSDRLQARAVGKKIVLDPKTCNFPHYRNVYCMTPNVREAAEGAEISIAGREDIIRAGKRLLERHNLDTLVITLGADGMAVFLPGRGIFHLPTAAKKVFDVTGAGDTVIAVIALGLSSGLDLLNSCVPANCAAGLVVGQVGAVGVTQEELTNALGSWTAGEYELWADL